MLKICATYRLFLSNLYDFVCDMFHKSRDRKAGRFQASTGSQSCCSTFISVTCENPFSRLEIYARFDTLVERRSESIAKEKNCSNVRHNQAIDFHSLNPLRILQIYWTGDKFREHVCGRIEGKRNREKKTKRREN